MVVHVQPHTGKYLPRVIVVNLLAAVRPPPYYVELCERIKVATLVGCECLYYELGAQYAYLVKYYVYGDVLSVGLSYCLVFAEYLQGCTYGCDVKVRAGNVCLEKFVQYLTCVLAELLLYCTPLGSWLALPLATHHVYR